MIYGANGYTGELIAREAKEQELTPILAGRSKYKIPDLAKELELDFRIFDLSSSATILDNLLNVDSILNCAGPFSRTSRPIIEACLAAKTHYFDITGEIDVFEAIRQREYHARRRGIMLMPGIGFDVVPTDCLAMRLGQMLPDADTLILAIDSEGRPSQGTAKTMIEGLRQGGKIREFADIKTVSIVHDVREIPFAHQTKTCVTIPWGDVSTAYYTTGIPNIRVYSARPNKDIRLLRLLRLLKPLLKFEGFANSLVKRLTNDERGPDEVALAKSRCYIWGQVQNKHGETVEAHLETPNGYALTVQTAITIMQHFLTHDPKRGVQTPAKMLGAEFIETIPGVKLTVSDAVA